MKKKQDVKCEGRDSRNKRSSQFVEFCQENNLIVTNTRFKLSKWCLYNWRSPQDIEDHVVGKQLDFITVNNIYRVVLKYIDKF